MSGSWTDETEKNILINIYNNLTFTLIRVNTIEVVLNISFILSEQVKIINSNLFKDLIDDMDEDTQVTKLQLENSILKQNLSSNFDKLNNTLAVVAQMQRMLIHHKMMPQDRLIFILKFMKSAPSSLYDDKNYEDATTIDIDYNLSDHMIPTTSLFIPEIVSSTFRTSIKKISFQYDNMSKDDWSAFTHKTNTLLTSCQLATLKKHKLKSKQALNFYWDLIQRCIIKAAEK
ncbi:12795_t:CDS:2, partial [Funneliformis geosporum]